ncbi:MAG: substrate-binding domain-containing protein, partial [Bacteroidota bacterium]
GYKRIAAIGNTELLSITRERLAGYRAALTDNGIEINESLIRYCKHGGMIAAEVETAVNALMKLSEPPDAIFASADKLTTGCLRMLRARKIQVPGDMGLIGFSNTDLTELLDPPLSIIKQPAFEMGEITTNLLLQLIESKRPVTDFETKMLTTELFIRGSTKKVKARTKIIA